LEHRNGGSDAVERRKARVHEMYAHHTDPVPVSITKIFTSPWGTGEPITKPQLIDALTNKRLESGRLETSDVTVDVFGDAAVVRGKSSDAFLTITFVNRGEGWKAVAMQ
jgi:hypothetical protein